MMCELKKSLARSVMKLVAFILQIMKGTIIGSFVSSEKIRLHPAAQTSKHDHKGKLYL